MRILTTELKKLFSKYLSILRIQRSKCFDIRYNRFYWFSDKNKGLAVYALVYILRIFFIISASLIMLCISSQCKNAKMAVLVNFAVFVLPIIVYLLGANVMVNACFNPLLSMNAVLNDFSAA